MPDLVDLFLAAESALERELVALAIFQPQTIATKEIRPVVNRTAKSFFEKFDAIRADILAADELDAIKLAQSCCKPSDFWYCYAELQDENAFQLAQKFGPDLIALRAVRKSLSWIQDSGILERGKYDG